MNRLWLLGGAGLAGVALVYWFSNRSAPADAGGGMQYPLVIGGGGGAPPANSGASTDNSISQMLASQLSMAQLQQATAFRQMDTQKELALAGFANQLDLANADLTKTKVQTLGAAFASLFGGPGAGSLNVDTPTTSAITSDSWDTSTPMYGTAALNKGSSSQAQTSSSGYTSATLNGTLGFDQGGNLAVNMNRQTASSLTPLAKTNGIAA